MRISCSPDSKVAKTNAKVDDAKLASGILIDDWDALFCAVSARLSAAVDEWPSQARENQPPDCAAQVRVIVLECVEAMNLLHTMLGNERR